MLPYKHHGWFIPVLYRHVSEGQEAPVALLADRDAPEEHDWLFAHLQTTTTFVGREKEVQELSALLAAAARGEEQGVESNGHCTLRPGTHHIALTGPAGIGKSALAYEVVRRNREKFSGGVMGISLQGGKPFGEALIEIAHQLHASTRTMPLDDLHYCVDLVLNALHSRASRALPCLLLLDSFEEVKEYAQLEFWHRFLGALPQVVLVLVSSLSNPTALA